MAYYTVDVAQLLGTNPYGDTDFTIEIDECKWMVHKSVLSEKSEYFADNIRDPFRHNRNGIVIASSTPWEMARLIQWLYLEQYEYNSAYPMSVQRQEDYHHLTYREHAGILHELTLDALVPSRTLISEFDGRDDFDSDRLEVHIDIEMAELARDYQIADLNQKCLSDLVKFLELRSSERSCKEIAEMFPRIFQVLEERLFRDVDFTDRMVEVLMAYKFASYRRQAPWTTYITPNGSTDTSPVIIGFQDDIAGYISRGGMFGVRLVRALENALQNSLQDREWPPEVFTGNSDGLTDFGGCPVDYPADAGQPL